MKLIRAALLSLSALASCKPVSCCSAPLSEAVLWGRVTIDTGGVASHAAMSAAAIPISTSCAKGTMYGWGKADSLGRYRIAVFGAGVVDSGCVFVGARFPTQGTTIRDTILGPFRMKFSDKPPLDSLNVDIVVPH